MSLKGDDAPIALQPTTSLAGLALIQRKAVAALVGLGVG